MARLSKYVGKRNFQRTPEPRPEPEARSEGAPLRFMVHKHDARRLHYDLRLEMEGALASWAVPRGPSLDPSQRRLAIQTEDHPLEYGDFEGRIPEGEYGAGDSIVWDRGAYDTVPPGQGPAMRRKGHIVFELEGEKLRGRWHLVRTRVNAGKEQWLFFKAKDEHANPGLDIVTERPESVLSGRRATRGPAPARVRASSVDPIQLLVRVWPPELATPTERRGLAQDAYIYEVKYDGYRALAGVAGRRAALQSRNGLDLAAQFPQVARELAGLAVSEAVLDGEVVPVRDGHVLGMQDLQTAGARPELFVFDLLWLDGHDLRARPIEERRGLLESVLVQDGELVHLAEVLPGELSDAVAEARRRGLEGVLAKRRGSTYLGGRTRDWLKVKLRNSADVVVVGFTPLQGSQGARVGAIGALIVAVQTESGLRYAGKVGTGFSDELRSLLWRLLDPERIPQTSVIGAPRARDAIWVTPRHVAEVSFHEWTKDGRLRAPVYHGLRPDKRPSDCVDGPAP